MDIKTDLHTHTIVSDHAYSTVMENVMIAKEKGLEAIAITDHAPALIDAPHRYYYANIDVIPDEVMGVRVLKGCEVNILDKEGTLDLSNEVLKKMDIVIASVHSFIYKDLDNPDNTKAYLKVLENEYVDILGHTGNPRCIYDIDKVLLKAKELRKFIEINNGTFRMRPDNIEICKEIAKRAKELEVGIVVNSDAHFCMGVGDIKKAISMLEEIDFPEELIVNRSYETLKKALSPRKNLN